MQIFAMCYNMELVFNYIFMNQLFMLPNGWAHILWCDLLMHGCVETLGDVELILTLLALLFNYGIVVLLF